MDKDRKPTTAKEIKGGATKLVDSPFTGYTYEIRKSNGLDYLSLDFMPSPDPTMPPEEQKEESRKSIEDDLGLQVRIQKEIVARCVISPKVTTDGEPSGAPEELVHVDLLGPDLDWLFVEIDEWTRGPESENPSTASGD